MKEEHAALYDRIRAFSLDEPGARFGFAQRLAKENRWDEAFARRVVEEYRKFMLLCVAAGHTVSPPAGPGRSSTLSWRTPYEPGGREARTSSPS
jgi:hypothetical protein